MEVMKWKKGGPLLGLVMVVAMVAAGCSAEPGTVDKAGGTGEPVVLRMATVNGDLRFTPQIEYFVDRVKKISEGNVRIEIAYEVGNFGPDAETKVVTGVATGEFDLGFVGTHVFESMGVDSLRALTAPMLIDSYALEDAVIESGMASQMMQGLEGVGVEGLAVLGGPMRKPVAVEEPLLAPEDWEGITFGVYRSEGQEQAIRPLATPLQVIGDARDAALEDGTLDGFETSMLSYNFNKQAATAPFVTLNVNLWPQTLAVIADPDANSELTPKQRAWLRQAATDAATRSTSLFNSEARHVQASCDAGARFAEASESDLSALEGKFAPAYGTLGENPEVNVFVERIQKLKQSVEAEPALSIPAGCTGEPPKVASGGGEAPAFLNGVYRYTITKEDVIKADMGDPADYPTTNTVTMDGGKFSVRGPYGGFSGTYEVEEDRIAFDGGEVTSYFSFTVDDKGNLHLKALPPTDPGDAFEFSVHPWTRIR